jgi:hypothetical protein
VRGGVYVYRMRKPGARFRIPLLSWHTGYVGETSSFYHRHQQHVYGLGKYATQPQPWSDREPYVWFRIPLPNWRWLRRSVETLFILLLWPVYNVQKNRWNPRRITPPVARQQRLARDAGRHPINIGSGWLAIIIAICAVVAWYWIGRIAS